jgi:hypothetical protein
MACAELVQRLEVEVVESFVPAPGVIILPCGEAERLRGLKMEDVEAAGPAIHLDEEAPAAIPNAKHTLFDLHLGPPFIELAEAHDGVAQRWDEVNAVKDSVLAGLGFEHDRADTLDLHL